MYRQLARLPCGAYARAAAKGAERGGARAVVRGAVGGFVRAPQSVRRLLFRRVFGFRIRKRRSADVVWVNRRSDALNSFAGDTALPGGKIDAQDVTVEDTAVSRARLVICFGPLASV